MYLLILCNFRINVITDKVINRTLSVIPLKFLYYNTKFNKGLTMILFWLHMTKDYMEKAATVYSLIKIIRLNDKKTKYNSLPLPHFRSMLNVSIHL